MLHIVTAEEMKEMDRRAIEETGIPSAVLMERAALAAADAVTEALADPERFPVNRDTPSVLVIAGPGRCGGDGIACARILHLRGIGCHIQLAGDPERLAPETAQQLRIAGNLGIPVSRDEPIGDSGLIVDALFGIGLSRPAEGEFGALIRSMNESHAFVVSVDIPSGLNADDGQPAGCAVRADVTVTMQLPKRGILLDPGRLYCGRLVIADIGIPDCAPEPAGRPLFAMTNQDLADLLPKRAPSGNKGTFGRVLLAAGSDGMAGAAVLSARSAIRSGAGMVKVLTDARNRVIIQTAVPEALYAGYSTAEEAEAAVRVSLGWADAVAAGPGLGTGSAASAIVRCLLSEADIPLVLDADALNLIAGDPSLRALLSAHNGPVTLTPHMGEMARLTGRSVRELKQNRFAAAAALASETGGVVVLKDARTVTAVPDGRLFLNLSGNSGLATAGSGDVLTGLTAGLLAGGTDPSVAGALASFLHGLAGDAAASQRGQRALTAGELPDALASVLKEAERRTDTLFP